MSLIAAKANNFDDFSSTCSVDSDNIGNWGIKKNW